MNSLTRNLVLAVLALIAVEAGAFSYEPWVSVRPKVPVLPANQLKFYLHFREPMARGEVFRYIRLVEIDKSAQEIAEVPEPFREVELWDETFTRMTLWFHPGRQKPGVNLNVDIGPILEEGKRYRLEISPEWDFEDGKGLTGEDKNTIRFDFYAGATDDVQPDPSGWTVERESERAIKILTGECIDPVSAEKRITFFDESGKAVVPNSFGSNSDYLFVSSLRWESGKYRLEVDPALEDVAGNSIARPFNLDIEKYPDFTERTEPVVVEFVLP